MRIHPGLFRTFSALQRRRLFLQALLRESFKIERALGRILFSSQIADDDPAANTDRGPKRAKEISLLEVFTDDVHYPKL